MFPARLLILKWTIGKKVKGLCTLKSVFTLCFIQFGPAHFEEVVGSRRQHSHVFQTNPHQFMTSLLNTESNLFGKRGKEISL